MWVGPRLEGCTPRDRGGVQCRLFLFFPFYFPHSIFYSY